MLMSLGELSPHSMFVVEEKREMILKYKLDGEQHILGGG
jgi:hypothetical protein